MNTFHRFFVTGLLTGLSCIYASTALADSMYQQQPYRQPYQYQQPQYQQPLQERSYGEKIGKKALNGVTNIATSPLEISKSIIRNTNAQDSNLIFGVIGGVLEGTLNTVFRGTAGMIDLSTFLIPTKAVVNPQYVWDDFYDVDTTYGETFRLDIDEQQPKFELPQ